MLEASRDTRVPVVLVGGVWISSKPEVTKYNNYCFPHLLAFEA